MARDFSIKQGIEVQTRQLSEWKQLLKDNVYIALEIYATKDNHLAKCGDDIKRGCEMERIIDNFLYYTRNGELESQLGESGYKEYLHRLELL